MMFKNFIIISVIFLLVAMQVVSATSYCVDNKTIVTQINKTYFLGNDTISMFENETFVCEYVCQNNQCVLPRGQLYGLVLLIIFLLIIFIAVLVRYLWV